jgi:hypothetical protein
MANRMFNPFRRLDPILIDELKSRYLAGEKHTVIEGGNGYFEQHTCKIYLPSWAANAAAAAR